MSEVRDGLYYSKEHEWVLVDGDVATVGITDYAQSSLGDIVFVELPEIGRRVEKGEAVAVVESVKAASDVYSPLSGEIIEVNGELDSSPEVVNSSPYDDGWFFKVRLADPDELLSLMTNSDYEEFIKDE